MLDKPRDDNVDDDDNDDTTTTTTTSTTVLRPFVRDNLGESVPEG